MSLLVALLFATSAQAMDMSDRVSIRMTFDVQDDMNTPYEFSEEQSAEGTKVEATLKELLGAKAVNQTALEVAEIQYGPVAESPMVQELLGEMKKEIKTYEELAEHIQVAFRVSGGHQPGETAFVKTSMDPMIAVQALEVAVDNLRELVAEKASFPDGKVYDGKTAVSKITLDGILALIEDVKQEALQDIKDEAL